MELRTILQTFASGMEQCKLADSSHAAGNDSFVPQIRTFEKKVGATAHLPMAR
jgi:hypothetical protein